MQTRRKGGKAHFSDHLALVQGALHPGSKIPLDEQDAAYEDQRENCNLQRLRSPRPAIGKRARSAACS